MEITRITNHNLKLLKEFIVSMGNSSNSFRYFKTRTIRAIDNHMVTFIGIIEENIPVCYGHLDVEEDLIWLGICVTAAYKGRGYGNCMMERLILYAKHNNVNEINLSVDKSNLSAIHLYEKFGFKMVKENEHIFFYKLVL